MTQPTASRFAQSKPGHSFPLGATFFKNGVNFSVYSKYAGRVELLLFDAADATTPSDVLVLDPTKHKTYHYWHVFVPGLEAGQRYAFRVDGPNDPSRGLRFDGSKILVDPYARAIDLPKTFSRSAAAQPGSNAGRAPLSVVVDSRTFDWNGDLHPRTPFRRTVIYELHVRGFTMHPSSKVPAGTEGTFDGLVAKIPYLKELGITAVELMPVFAFDPQDAPAGRVNYWGYSPINFFALHPPYSARWRATGDPLAVVQEFRDMIAALHAAGIEAILDVVYNHTAEGGTGGPTYSFRGFANGAYYLLDPHDRSTYLDYTGCGNTLRANHPVVRRMILDSLRWWVREMHVDGFRFDLAAILSRDERGTPIANPPTLWDIESDPVLCQSKLIAEAWDAAGLYQVGSFTGDSWKEWNGRFRDDVRRFMFAEPNSVRSLPPRLVASPDLYAHEEREPEQSVNFITCHDGFTLNDLVSYERKHNEANGEANRDGNDWNHSNNHGVEGPTDDPEIEAIRARQIRNLLALVLVSLGTPMILMGDEARRTQKGNNNAWCIDNETTWFDWSLVEQHADLVRFARLLIAARTRPHHPLAVGTTLQEVLENADLRWHGVHLDCPDWGERSHSLAIEATRKGDGLHAWMALNAYHEPLEFELPKTSGRWLRRMDTSLPSPADIADETHLVPIEGTTYRVAPHSIVILLDRSSLVPRA
jgi:glycogen operon protein